MARCTAVALEGYQRRIGRYGPSLARGFIAACGLAPPQRALDVGCGTGALTAELVRTLGPDAVAGADPHAVSVQICRERLPDVDVRVAPAEALPFGDASFDAALAQLVVAFMDDPRAGVLEMCRVVRPGGTVAACVWDFGEGMRALRAFWDAATAIDQAARDFDQANSHAYTTAEGLAELWSSAGIRDVRTGQVVAESRYADAADLWEPMQVPDGTPGRYLENVPAGRREEIRRRMLDALEVPDAGAFTLTARAWFVRGSSPGPT